MSNLPQKMGKTTSNMMVALGSRLQSPSIRRVDVADKTLGRGIILSEQALAVLLYYHDPGKDIKEGKGYYLVSEEDVLTWGLTASLYYVILVGRLNTDARGMIIDDSVRVEYLRLKESSYNDLMDDIEEVGTRSLAMKKVTQGEYSHVECKPSVKLLQDPNHVSAAAKIEKMNIDALFKLVLREIGRDFAAFKERLGFKGAGPGNSAEDDFENTGAPTSNGTTKREPKATAASNAFEDASNFTDFEEVKETKSEVKGNVATPSPHAKSEVDVKEKSKAKVADEFDLGDEFPDMK